MEIAAQGLRQRFAGTISVWWQRFSLLKGEITALEIALMELTILNGNPNL